MIPKNTIDEILKKIDIVDVVGKFIPLTKKGKNYWGTCPFHDDHDPSMSVSKEKQLFKCFTCGTGGNAISFIKNFKNISYIEAIKELAEIAQVEISENFVNQFNIPLPLQQAYSLNKTFSEYANYTLATEEGKKALEYLQNRGYNNQLIKEKNTGYIANEEMLKEFLIKKGFPITDLIENDLFNEQGFSKWKGRIVYPVEDQKGNIVGFTGRALSKNLETKFGKYVNTSATTVFHKNKSFYNLFHAMPAIRQKKEVILMEGSVDTDLSFDIGVTNAIATLGTALTDEHVNILRRMNASVKLCYDGDKAGQAATEKAYYLLKKAGIEPLVVTLKNGLDPADIIFQNKEEFINLIQKKESFLDFKLQTFVEKSFIETNEYARDFMKIVVNYNNPMMEEHYLRRLAETIGINEQAIQKEYLKMKNFNTPMKAVKVNNDSVTKIHEKAKIVYVNFQEKAKFIHKDEIHTNFDMPNANNAVVAFDRNKIFKTRAAVLEKYIHRKNGKILETVITCVNEGDIDALSAQAIADETVAIIGEENKIPKENLQYVAFLHQDTNHPHIHIQLWQEEPYLDKYKLTAGLIQTLQKNILEKLNETVLETSINETVLLAPKM